MHCLFRGSSLQQPWQHQSARAVFYADPQLGPVLPRTLAVTSHNIPTFSAHGLAAILDTSGQKTGIFLHLNIIHPFTDTSSHDLSISSISSLFQSLSYFGLAGRGSASLKLCTCKAASPWSQWPSPASQWVAKVIFEVKIPPKW